jgi:integrase
MSDSPDGAPPFKAHRAAYRELIESLRYAAETFENEGDGGIEEQNLLPVPGAGPEHKNTKTLSEQILLRLWKELGLEATPHQFRHAAAYIMLKADPGNYELVRRVLGHRSITTTLNFYIGLETLEATRLFGEMVTDLARGEAPAKLPRKKTNV